MAIQSEIIRRQAVFQHVLMLCDLPLCHTKTPRNDLIGQRF